ncbi:TrmH family RNA methyltransferase [Candidatus Karelsulcia muelleri]|uniref:TrmH family RNA methyltransferase n=1 Tax=Candidatus Karelsulcia muelleri TaxID=336810 RepID=UPI000B92A043|nr:RNA methyltransferase [Candidatus Karelsulcia muelleri]ASS47004.1 23S rRNA (guanosine-2'-O-)-methyltransferase RlmB [Candidatus Karelsulcia muelleri]
MKKNILTIYGINPLYEAIKYKKKIYKIFIIKKFINLKLKKIIKFSYLKKIPIFEIFKKNNKNNQGVFAIIDPIEFYKIEDIIPNIYYNGKIPLLLILDSITDVRNFGSIVRTSACTGVDAIIISNNKIVNSDSIKTSSGGLFKVPICKEKNIIKIIKILKNYGIQIIAVTEKTDYICYNINYRNPTAFILGSEEKGISINYLSICNNRVKLPLIKNSLTSLNVSVACGAILYEALRQRL